ncbi:MAG TPA: hypothetical protein VFJ58_29775, partial [Armatimonadota bacterium]|nr:hypothetical protein [Armatimonadota bacterium]
MTRTGVGHGLELLFRENASNTFSEWFLSHSSSLGPSAQIQQDPFLTFCEPRFTRHIRVNFIYMH